MYGRNFYYNGRSSEEFSLMIGSFDGNDEVPFSLGRSPLVSAMNRYRSTPNHMGAQYSSVLSFTITLIKNVCNKTQAEMVFTEDEVDEINAWLTSPDYPILFHMYDYETPAIYNKYDYYGIFNDV